MDNSEPEVNYNINLKELSTGQGFPGLSRTHSQKIMIQTKSKANCSWLDESCKPLLLFLLLFSVACYSQNETRFKTAEHEQAGISFERLNQLRPAMQKYIDEHKLPGLITMVARHGKIVSYEKYGLMDVDKPMQFNTIFRLASMTKPVTSVAVMMLYDQGYFGLDDPVSKYIPEFKDLKVFSSLDKDGFHLEAQNRPMTIRDLLTHTSGLGSGWGDSPVDSLYRTSNLSGGTLQDMIKKLADIPLLYQPGTRWIYGRSTDVLGYLVEVISGKSLDVFFNENIFIPLNMENTGFYVPKDKLSQLAAVYCPDDSLGLKVIFPDTSDISRPPKFLSGNGGLFSTAVDYMVFSQMMLNKGEYKGKRLLKSQTVDLMTANHLTNEIMPDDDFLGPIMKGMGFGFGFAVLKDSTRQDWPGSVNSYWWSGSANTCFFIDPEEDLIMILMTQFVPNFYYPVFREFRELVYRSVID